MTRCPRVSPAWGAAAVWLVCAAAGAQPPDAAEVADRVRAAPPEAMADLLLGLLEGGRITDPALRGELLDDVWAASFRIAAPAPGARVHPAVAAPSDADPHNMMGGLRLDRLSVRTRVLRLMLDSTPAQARDLFVQWEPFEFPDADCAVPVLPDVSGYYELAAGLFERAFTPQEREEGRHHRFLEEVLLRVRSPLELAPAAAMLAQARLDGEQRRYASALFAERLGAVQGGNRAFYIAVRRQNLLPRVRALIDSLPAQEPAAHTLAFALRSFLAAHLAAPRCRDIAGLEQGFRAFREDKERLEQLRANPKIQIIIREEPSLDFNTTVLPALAARGFALDPLPPVIDAEDVVDGWQDDEPDPGASSTWWNRLRQLAGNRPPAPDTEAAWRNEYEELLGAAHEEAATKDHPPLFAFHRILGAYRQLADLALDANLAEQAARRWVDYLCGADVQQHYPAHWLAAVKSAVSRSRPFSEAARKDVEARIAGGMSIPGTNALVPRALQQSLAGARHPVVALYAWVDTVYPGERSDWR